MDKVVFEPDGSSRERIQFCGLFVVPVPISSGLYKAPERGVLYFSVPPDRTKIARKEWVELKRLAGSGEVLGFTEYWVPRPSDPQGNLIRQWWFMFTRMDPWARQTLIRLE